MHKKVAIILVNYKDYVNRFLAECRDSLRAQNYPRDLYKVYIIDNASSEDSKKYIKENYPEAIIVPRSDGNYAAANNAGLRKGREDGCELFVIANMDTKFDSAWLGELVGAVESDPKIGIAQSKMLLYPKTAEEWKNPKINSLGNIMHYLGFGFTSFYGQKDEKFPLPPSASRRIKGGKNGYPEINGYASGCSFIIKKDVLDKIGGYNEEFYMYHDDIEMSWKTKLVGYRIVLAPKSIMYHKYEFGRSILMLYYMERNRYIIMFTFYKLPTLLLVAPAIIFMDLGMLFYSILSGWFKVKIRVYSYFLKPSSWIKVFQARKEVKKMRRVNPHTKNFGVGVKDRDIVKYFSGEILFQEISNPVLKYIANPIFNLYWQAVKRVIFW